MSSSEPQAFEGWCILELFGHRKLAGYVTEQTIAGAGFLRIDVPARDQAVTQFYPPGSVYAITPVSEEVARLYASQIEAAPVQRYELPPPRGPTRPEEPEYDPIAEDPDGDEDEPPGDD